jgi:hypothetical protein
VILDARDANSIGQMRFVGSLPSTLSPAKLSIKQLVDRRLWKNYKRVLQGGDAITEEFPR